MGEVKRVSQSTYSWLFRRRSWNRMGNNWKLFRRTCFSIGGDY
jgi:hypothetical protein